MSGASLRVGGSLDVTTVLRAVIDNARALTGARLGAIATIDEAGEAGLRRLGPHADEHRRMMAWSDGPRFFTHLRDLPGPLRLRDLGVYAASLGLSLDLMQSKTFAGTPLRHLDVLVGNFFLAEKTAGRVHERGRRDSGAVCLAGCDGDRQRPHVPERASRPSPPRGLVETSPVGVAASRPGPVAGVAQSGGKANRRGPERGGRSLEQLLDVVVCRRADGQEVALSEFSLAQLIPSAGAVRAEEMTLEVPDGRRVTALVNATPIHAEDGTVESMVVTLQDLAPLEEQERLRTEFLSQVSHELRAH